MNRRLVFTKKKSEEILDVPDSNLEKSIQEKYDYKIGYVPEGYNMAFLLAHDDQQDSRKDKWKVIFFKRTKKINGTITLDNIDDFSEDADSEYEIFKELDGNYEDVINIATDIIKKYREVGKKEIESKVS